MKVHPYSFLSVHCSFLRLVLVQISSTHKLRFDVYQCVPRGKQRLPHSRLTPSCYLSKLLCMVWEVWSIECLSVVPLSSGNHLWNDQAQWTGHYRSGNGIPCQSRGPMWENLSPVSWLPLSFFTKMRRLLKRPTCKRRFDGFWLRAAHLNQLGRST